MKKKPVVLLIRDGWGHRDDPTDNAIATANTPNDDRYFKKYPSMLIEASGEAVGLPDGYQGNSEVGHMTIGAGRTIFQSLMRINKSLDNNTFFDIAPFKEAIANCRVNGTNLHLMGLLQVEGVHSHMSHLFGLLDICRAMDFSNVFVHVFTDGRDSPVTDSIKHLKELIRKLDELGIGRIATVSGRYYAMDRDGRWDRTQMAYDCIVNALAHETFHSCAEKVREFHKNGVTDEFIRPTQAIWYEGVREDDSVIFFNFRTDRTRQLTMAMVEDEFEGWSRTPLKIFFVAMTQYYRPMNARVAFEELEFQDILGEILSRNHKRQLRISETEKYAHVTFFFNAQKEIPFDLEDRIMIPSPGVATYDLCPKMSASIIGERVCKELERDLYDLVVINLVNGDMVGHTGIAPAIVEAVEAVDASMGMIVDKVLEKDGVAFIFADHGNAEDQRPAFRTSHTMAPVPLCVVSNREIELKKKAGLKNIASSVLQLLGLKKPAIMADSLFK